MRESFDKHMWEHEYVNVSITVAEMKSVIGVRIRTAYIACSSVAPFIIE